MRRFISTVFLFISVFLAYSQQPAFEWVSQCGNPPNTTDTKTVMAPGPDGQFYIAGEFLDTTQFNDKMLISSGGTDIFLANYTQDGNPIWANKVGAADYDYVQNLFTDGFGNLIMTGYFYGDTQIGPDQYSSYGSQDIFIAMFGPDGSFLWSRRAGGQSADYVTGLAVDFLQNIVVTGYYYGSLDFDDTTLVSSGSSDIFIAKFSSDGNLLWARSAGGSSSDQACSVSCDIEGNILISGSFYYDITLGDTTLVTLNPVGVVVARYMPDGRFNHAFQLDGTYLSTENYLASDHDGGFYLAGNFSEWIHFGCHSFDAGEFDQDIYIAKYGTNCENLWARQGWSESSDQVVGLNVDEDNNLYITGHYLDTINFEQITLLYTLCCGSREIFIVKYNPYGGVLWGQQISGARASIHSSVLNSENQLLLSGLFTEDVTFGSLTLSNYDGFHNYISSLQTEVYTDVADSPEINNMKVFPNPASEKIRILNLPPESNPGYLIYNAQGNLVVSGTLSNQGTIDISFLPAGLYFLDLLDLTGQTSQSVRLIKQ